MATDIAARSTYVRAFVASGMTQAEFCAAHRAGGGPSERTLRSWLAALTKPTSTTAEVRAIFTRAVQDLQKLLQGLDAVEDIQAREAEALDDRTDDAAAAASCPAAGREPGAAPQAQRVGEHQRPAPAVSDETERILLDDIAAAVQAVVADAGSTPAAPDTRDACAATRPAPFGYPWSGGGGLLGPF